MVNSGEVLVIYNLYFALILLTSATPLSSAILECSPGTQQVLSYNNSLISPDNITASNQDVNFNPDDYLFHRNNVPLRLWCTESITNGTNISEDAETVTLLDYLSSTQGQDRSGQSYSINVSMSRQLLVTQIGSSGFSNGFINNFTVMYATEETNFTTYQLDELKGRQEFIVSKIDTVFSLKRPFPALWLRFQINNGVISPSGRLCWHLTLYGCLIEEAVTKQQDETASQPITTPISNTLPSQACPLLNPTTSSHVATTTIEPPIYTTTPTEVLQTPTPQTVVVRDYQILIIVLPAAIVTILLVVCIVAIGVCICVRHSNNIGWRSQKDDYRSSSDMLSTSTNTLRIVENGTLYKSSSPLLSLATNEGRGISEQRDDIIDLNTPLYENCTRETIPSNKESGYYEPINPISDEDSVHSADSMVDNPTYSVPFPVGQPRPLLSQPHPPLPPIPIEGPPLPSGVTNGTLREREEMGGVMNMVDNECYRAPGTVEGMEISLSQSFSNKLPNDYETPL